MHCISFLCRQKYFYSVQNVDIKDPVQLNLQFVQVIKIVSSYTGYTISH